MTNTETTLEWHDSKIRSISLAGIEHKSNWLRIDAEDLTGYVRSLSTLPRYETLAEEAFARAELALSEALLCVKLLKTELAMKRTATHQPEKSNEH